jgi:hypothetical protein
VELCRDAKGDVTWSLTGEVAKSRKIKQNLKKIMISSKIFTPSEH